MPFLYTTIFTGICFGIIKPILKSKKFNSKDWIENTSLRYRMTNDLKENVLIGKTKAKVIELLGNNDGECGFKSKNSTICYSIPDPDNISILDHYELVIEFNLEGKVVNVTTELI